jgi:hypothetical protein
MPHHRSLQEFKGCSAVSGLRDDAFQHFALVIDSPPKVVCHAVDLHVDLVQMPLPLTARAHRLDTLAADLGGKHRTEPVPPVSHRLVANFDATLVQKIFDISERQREPDVEHHRQTDDLWAGLELLEMGAFCHAKRLTRRPARLKRSSSDNTVPPVPHRLMADLNAALVQKILDVVEREREPDVEHHRQSDDLGARLEVSEMRLVMRKSSRAPWAPQASFPLTTPQPIVRSIAHLIDRSQLGSCLAALCHFIHRSIWQNFLKFARTQTRATIGTRPFRRSPQRDPGPRDSRQSPLQRILSRISSPTLLRQIRRRWRAARPD